ncbi:hypothetical protein MASR1M42_07240 [Azonexus hydrophilus]
MLSGQPACLLFRQGDDLRVVDRQGAAGRDQTEAEKEEAKWEKHALILPQYVAGDQFPAEIKVQCVVLKLL